jgi:hypothetical protein
MVGHPPLKKEQKKKMVNQEQFEKETKYRNNFDEYRILSRQAKEIADRMDAIKERIAIMLHEDRINEKILPLANGENWKAGYQTTTRQNTDLKLLMEMLGPTRYAEVVTPKESTYLTIKKAGKEKKDTSKLTSKPVEESDGMPDIPTGTMLS